MPAASIRKCLHPVKIPPPHRKPKSRRTPSAMLRLPPTARSGDVITLRFDDLSELKTMVRDCDANECLAAGTLTPDEWQHLSATNSLQIMFPALARQWVILNLPVEGLPAAM